MIIALRFVNKDDFIKKRIFDIVHVKDTLASTLKDNISYVLFQNCLDIQSIHGERYDSKSNMSDEWK